MADQHDITGEWVEIAEDCTDDTLVFLRNGPDVPPGRGRRQMHLTPHGLAEAEAPGPTDKLENSGSGGWVRDGNTIHIRVPGWEGTYDIEDLQDTRLILRRR